MRGLRSRVVAGAGGDGGVCVLVWVYGVGNVAGVGRGLQSNSTPGTGGDCVARVYTYMYTFRMYSFQYMDTHTLIYVYTHTHARIRTLTHVYVCACLYVCMRVWTIHTSASVFLCTIVDKIALMCRQSIHKRHHDTFKNELRYIPAPHHIFMLHHRAQGPHKRNATSEKDNSHIQRSKYIILQKTC